MVRHSRTLAIGAVVAVVAIGGAVVSAQRPGVGPRTGGPQAGLALRALDLTDAQREQVRQLTQQHREQTRVLLGQVRTAQEARRQAVEAIPVSEPQIRSAAQALADAGTELAIQQARLQADIYALLTPDQQARLQAMRAERDVRLKQRLGRVPQRGPRRPRPQA